MDLSYLCNPPNTGGFGGISYGGTTSNFEDFFLLVTDGAQCPVEWSQAQSKYICPGVTNCCPPMEKCKEVGTYVEPCSCPWSSGGGHPSPCTCGSTCHSQVTSYPATTLVYPGNPPVVVVVNAPAQTLTFTSPCSTTPITMPTCKCKYYRYYGSGSARGI